MVLFYYAISVIPDQIAIFKNRFGVGSDALAKLNRLRAAVYLQGEDNVLMKYGFRLDKILRMSPTHHERMQYKYTQHKIKSSVRGSGIRQKMRFES